MGRHVASIEEMRNMCKILVGKPEEKRPLERPRCRWDDNIKIVLIIGFEGLGWIHLTLDRNQWWAPVNKIKNLGCSIKGVEVLDYLSVLFSFLRRTLHHGVH
jgi:hypothetical protein